jgi:hypothetical protein
MKRFSFMISFFVWIITYNVFVERIEHNNTKWQTMSSSEIHYSYKKETESIMKSIFIASISSFVTYFGTCGLLTFLRKK